MTRRSPLPGHPFGVRLFRGRLARFVAVFATAYATAAGLCDAPTLILVSNDLVMSAALGVCIGYAPVLPPALVNPHPSKGEYLGAGIFFVSVGMFVLRIGSMVARDLGRPEIYNTHFVTAALASCFMGAIMHLRALNAPDGAPPRRWTKPGMIVAIGGAIVLCSWSLHIGVGPHATVQLK